MSSVIVLSIIIIAGFIFLYYLFNDARIELDSLTIAAVEAKSESVTATRTKKTAQPRSPEISSSSTRSRSLFREEKESAVAVAPVIDYEYRELLKPNAENYVVPQWMVNFFSSSDMCHTLDHSDKVVFIVKLIDSKNAEATYTDISPECDMSTQTVTLKLCFGEGAAAEVLKTKFYLFERGDLFELNRLVRQEDVRIDILTRASDYTLEYVDTLYARIPQDVLTQLKNLLSKIPL